MTELRSFLLSNSDGDEVCITNYGARIVQWHTKVEGEERNIVLGYSSLADYLEDPAYLGAIVGPFANRIAFSTVNIDGQDIQLTANEGRHHLHGGPNALSDVIWQLDEHDERNLSLSYVAAPDFNGYPGAITFRVHYRLSDDSALTIKLLATTDKPTIIGPSSHAYFNLAGIENCSDEHMLQINADYFTEVDDANIPTGNILPVVDTRFDFTKPRILKHHDDRDKIDHNFVLNKRDDWQAILISPDKKLQLHASSSYPGLQVYTGDYLANKFSPRQGFCLEPQYFPDSPNHSNFPFQLATPESPFNAEISYKLIKFVQSANDSERD